MNVRFLEFVRCVGALETAPGDRGCVIAGAVAYAVAKHLPLPSAPDASPTNYYTFNNSQAAKDFISLFNEQAVFDVKEALDEVREFWMLRYNAAHPPRFPVYDMSVGFYDNMLGTPKWVDQESHCFNNLYKGQIFTLAQCVGETICALNEAAARV
jgi:hypothetical protein